jgi:hypothetical protein
MIDEGATAVCPYCGQSFWIALDLGGGRRQRFVSDCETCCRPIRFDVHVDPAGEIRLEAKGEDDAG